MLAAWSRPTTAIGTVVAMYGIEQFFQAKSAFFVQRGSWVNIAAALIVAVAFGSQWYKKNMKINTSKTFWLILAIFAYSYLTFYWTKNHPIALQEWKDAIPYLIVFTGVAPFLIENPRNLRYGLGFTLFLGGIFCFALFFTTNWQARGIELAGHTLTKSGKFKEITGAPLAIAELGGAIAIIASLMSFKRIKFWGLLKWALMILGLALVFKTQSRGQVLATFIVILIFQPVSGRAVGMKSILVGIFGTIFMAIVFYVLLPIMDSYRWEIAGRAFGGRLSSAQNLMSDFIHTPSIWLTGRGAGSSWFELGSYPHNVPVEILYEEGLIGFGLFFGFCFIIFRRIVTFTNDRKCDPETRRVLATIFALFTFFLIISLKQGSAYNSISLFMFGIIADRLTAKSRMTNQVRYLIPADQASTRRQYAGL